MGQAPGVQHPRHRQRGDLVGPQPAAAADHRVVVAQDLPMPAKSAANRRQHRVVLRGVRYGLARVFQGVNSPPRRSAPARARRVAGIRDDRRRRWRCFGYREQPEAMIRGAGASAPEPEAAGDRMIGPNQSGCACRPTTARCRRRCRPAPPAGPSAAARAPVLIGPAITVTPTIRTAPRRCVENTSHTVQFASVEVFCHPLRRTRGCRSGFRAETGPTRYFSPSSESPADDQQPGRVRLSTGVRLLAHPHIQPRWTGRQAPRCYPPAHWAESTVQKGADQPRDHNQHTISTSAL